MKESAGDNDEKAITIRHYSFSKLKLYKSK